MVKDLVIIMLPIYAHFVPKFSLLSLIETIPFFKKLRADKYKDEKLTEILDYYRNFFL